MAYLDWSGLRPMTEMEYEKACRGTRPAVLNEYAWGTTDISCRQRVIVSQGITFQQLTSWGEAGEGAPGTAVNGRCFCGIGITIDNPGDGTARNGIFATSTTGRSAAGAGFYGAMELSGSVWEFCIRIDILYSGTVVSSGSSPYTGVHGDGSLNSNGDANVSDWPTLSTIQGTGVRGSSWEDSVSLPDFFKTSFRPFSFSSGQTTSDRLFKFGIRGVITFQ